MNTMSRWQVARERGIRDHSNERGAMDAGRSPVLSAIWQNEHGGNGLATSLDWILNDTTWDPCCTIKADPFKCGI